MRVTVRATVRVSVRMYQARRRVLVTIATVWQDELYVRPKIAVGHLPDMVRISMNDSCFRLRKR